ncbi:hypothetical protein PRIPAC_88791 [Pristionchus pacificus]|uniref:Protein kinase domain-containing protein n=1 Tax=Pristionchus pacificus TaxID=54126 RepID=A0A2A6CWA4_PRIPA|nr:hypothetical protein PRIPAC_88791 [Pristionchus pacificus]|eukprot:PDM82327.1 protein kinase [Pristionchus pacificus]
MKGVRRIDMFLSIHNGMITANCTMDDGIYGLATAQFPVGYFTQEEFESEFLKKFVPQKFLGAGGFGSVLKALNFMDECSYAVKQIPFKGSEQLMYKKLGEVRALAKLRHEGIVSYNSSWTEEPPVGWQFTDKDDCMFIYVQMELCKESLRHWLDATTDRDVSQAKLWFKQLVSAAGYLHGNEKIHRDINPSNILFSYDGRLKICDLGVVAECAFIDGQEIDKTRTAIGTKKYMAPEQSGSELVELCVYLTSDQDEFVSSYVR